MSILHDTEGSGQDRELHQTRVNATLPRMKLTGDPDGLAALKSFQEGNRDYLKFLIQEATSVFEHHVDFKGPDGTRFRLIHDVKTGEFRVEKKAE